jgi:AraC-like DNA-binding protein
VARAAHLSQFHFQRLFRQHYGVTPKQVITALRIAEVQRLALAGMSFKDAADAAGFAHQSHMTTRFKRAVGVTPRTWLASTRLTPPLPAADAAHAKPGMGESCGLSCGSAPGDLAAPHATSRVIPPDNRAR